MRLFALKMIKNCHHKNNSYRCHDNIVIIIKEFMKLYIFNKLFVFVMEIQTLRVRLQLK